jgi:hypothetical protein
MWPRGAVTCPLQTPGKKIPTDRLSRSHGILHERTPFAAVRNLGFSCTPVPSFPELPFRFPEVKFP